MLTAVPVTTWLTGRSPPSTEKTELTAPPAAIAPARPSAVLPLKYAIASATNAPASIAPSLPILITPLSSTSSSPSAASRMGVAMVIAEVRNASSIRQLRKRRHRGRIMRRAENLLAEAAPGRGVEGEDDQDGEALDNLPQLRRDALSPLHPLRAVVERA